MRRLLILLCLGYALGEAQSITYQALSASAHENSHRLKLRSIDTSIETARLESVYSTLYPQLSLTYNTEYSRNLDSASLGSISVGDTTINSSTQYKNSLAFRLNYELYHFGATMKQIEASEKEIEVKKLESCNEAIKLDLELLDTYAKALKASDTRDYKSKMLLLRKELYTIKQRLYTAGKESRVSIGDEAIRIIDLEREIEKAKMEYGDSLISLSRLSHVALDIDTTQLTPISTGTVSMKNTFDDTPQYKQYQERIFQKHAEISMNQRSQLPTVSLYSAYYLYGSDTAGFSEAMDSTRPNSWNAGVALRWTLFEGFKYNSELQRLKLELNRIKEERDLAQREFEYETKSKQEQLERLEQLTKNETNALGETRAKVTMTQRLRAHGEADAVSDVSAQLESLERELTLAIEMTERDYTAYALSLQHTKADQCTPR